jgi:hypothetical protein
MIQKAQGKSQCIKDVKKVEETKQINKVNAKESGILKFRLERTRRRSPKPKAAKRKGKPIYEEVKQAEALDTDILMMEQDNKQAEKAKAKEPGAITKATYKQITKQWNKTDSLCEQLMRLKENTEEGKAKLEFENINLEVKQELN